MAWLGRALVSTGGRARRDVTSAGERLARRSGLGGCH